MNNQPGNPLGFDNIYGGQPTPSAPVQPQMQTQPQPQIQPQFQPQMQPQPQFQPQVQPQMPQAAQAQISSVPTAPKKNTGKIIGIIAGAVAVIATILVVVFMLGNKSSNPLLGTWSCTRYSSTNSYNTPTTKLKLDKNKSYQYGDYSNLAGNHYGGTSYTIEKLNKDSADGKHFRIEFGPITEYIVDGESIDTGSSKMDPIEFVLLNEKSDDGKQTAFITFEHTYSMYTCEAE